jgi:heme exporter protein D
MNWGSLGEFVSMGGYGLYVWGSFAMCALVAAVECAGIGARRRRLRALVAQGAGERQSVDERPLHHEG